jgi:hypothetical protein
MTLNTTIAPLQGRRDYLALGERRSLRKFAHHDASINAHRGSLALKPWCKRHAWVRAAGTHDRDVGKTPARRVSGDQRRNSNR